MTDSMSQPMSKQSPNKQANPNVLLNVKNLVTHVGSNSNPVVAVNDISFSINAGETFALVGESGSGKSITALSIMRLLPSSGRYINGEITFNGTDVLRIAETDMRSLRGSGIAMIFQEPMTSLNPVMTIAQQIGEAVLTAYPDIDGMTVNSKILELLDLVGIKDAKRRMSEYPHQFSGGMRQRVMIAIALAGEPELLIADEPTTALDVTIQAQVLDLIKEIQQKRKMALMLVTHDLGVVKHMADKIAVMRHGNILEQSDNATFFTQPQHEYSQRLFDSVPSIEKRGRRLSTVGDDSAVDKPENTAIEEITTNVDPNQTVLRINDLKTWFPIKEGIFKRTIGHVKAVDGVSLDIKAGQTLALVGESGSGKSTLAKSVIRLLQPNSGSIEFNGEDLSQLSNQQMTNLRTDLQIIFQDPYSSMNPRMLVRDILSEGMKALGVQGSSEKREQRMLELLALTGLPADSLNRYPHQFSGGQRQRICIARALAVDPKLIVCDEPTSALDVSVQAQILNLLKDLQQRLGLSYLFITHNISVVSYIADDVAVMYNGKIVEHGSVEEVLLKPQHDYTKNLMDAVPSI